MKRKIHTLDFKRRAVARLANGQKAIDICRKLKIRSSMLYAWRAKLKAKAEKKVVAKPSTSVHDAVVYLRKARDAALREITREPTRWNDPVYVLATLALRALEGDK